MTFERGKNDARTRSELHNKSIFTAAAFVVNEHDDASNLQRAHRVLVKARCTRYLRIFFFTRSLKVFVLFLCV